MDPPGIRARAEGISAKTQDLYNASTSKITDYILIEDGKVNGGIEDPCENCAYLMKENSFTVAKFEVPVGLKRRTQRSA